MPLCECCAKLDFLVMALSQPQIKSSERTETTGCIEHHNDMTELQQCAFAPEGGCRLCEIFVISWMVSIEENPLANREFFTTFEELTCKAKAAKYLEMLPHLSHRPLYAGYRDDDLWFVVRDPIPGVGLWMKEESEKELSDETIGYAKFSLDRTAIPESGSPLHNNVSLRNIHEDPASPECIDVARGWLRECLENHPRCRESAAAEQKLPTRVIDVGSECQDPKLVVPGHAVGRYVAFSYCWGGKSSHSVMLTKETLAQFQQGIPLTSLPRTLQDAVHVARWLGIPYVWIDAICIIQDSEEDWMDEAGRMNEVYSNATLGLFATNAESAASGFLGRRRNHVQLCVPYAELASNRTTLDYGVQAEDAEKLFLRFDHPGHHGDDEYDRSRWGRRGWTLQERLSPLRGLSYTELQMTWNCLTCEVRENGLGQEYGSRQGDMTEYVGGATASALMTSLASRWNALTRLQGLHVGELPVAKFWYYVVKNYQIRSLSSESDRLPAVAGLAKTLENRTLGTDRYFAGLWESDFVAGLWWEVWMDAPESPLEHESHVNVGTDAIAVPSWSWASTVGGVYCRLHDDDQSRFCVESQMTIQTLEATSDEERFIPRSPLVLQVSASCRLLSTSWYSGKDLADIDDLAQAALEKVIFDQFAHDDGNEGAAPDYGYQWGRTFEFAEKHRPWEGQHFLAMQVLERKLTNLQEIDVVDDVCVFFMILESVKDEPGRYRRVAGLTLDTNMLSMDYKAPIMERNGVKIYEPSLVQMIREQQWQRMDLQLV